MEMNSGKYFVWMLATLVMLGFYRTASADTLANHFRVVGLFEPGEKAQRLAFTNAIEKMNLDYAIGSKRMVVYYVEDIQPNDSFEANKIVCRQLKVGIAAVFGPSSKVPRAHVQSICQEFAIPHLSAQWDSRETMDYFSVSVYPNNTIIGGAHADLIRYWNWKSFTVIYEDDDGLLRLQEVLKATKGNDYKLTVRKLEPFQDSYISMFKDMKAKQEYHVIVDCDVNKVQRILHEALKVNMLSEYYHFHFTTLDLSTVDLEDYKHSGANVTAYRLIDPNRNQVKKVTTEWSFLDDNGQTSPLLGKKQLPALTALMYDAVDLFVKGLQRTIRSRQTETALMYDAVDLFFRSLSATNMATEVATQELNCNKKSDNDGWKFGNSFLNFIKSMDFEGLSGRVHFDDDGSRKDIKLDLVQLDQAGLRTTGNWTKAIGVKISNSYDDKLKENKNKLTNKTLKVVTVYEMPYLGLKSKPDETGEMHEGFMIDLLNLIKTRLPFNYSVYEVKDQAYGRESNGNWDGMVGDLMKRENERADMAAAGMTITYEREKVVDFTKPFLNLGITILYKKPTRAPPKLFSFLQPLSAQVWMYMLSAYLCVSFMLFVIARFSPYEWANPHPCNEDSDLVENQFTVLNSLWFTIGSVMQQGCEIAPRAISTRMVACIWWFFTLIMISSYTANLAAFLTVERMVSPIESADDLAKQTAIKYGTLKSGSSRDFFRTSDIPTFKTMWSFMSQHETSVFVNSTAIGVSKVKNSNYAYIAESLTIDYQVQRNCDLQQVGGLLDSKGYGIAFPKDSPWTELISREIIYFQENQQIQKLYNKWWKEKSGGKCDIEEKKDASSLGVKHVGGVFVVLVGGLGLGVLLAFLEFMWKAKKNAKIDKQSFCSEMSEELRFAVRCCGSREKSSRRVPSKDIVDNNGIQFAPLTGMNHRNVNKEVYA